MARRSYPTPKRDVDPVGHGGPVRASGPITAAVRARIRAALFALPAAEREWHRLAVAALLHLVEHCKEGREPHVFVAGRRAYAAVRWAGELFGHTVVPCTPDCIEPGHVTMRTRPIGGEEERGGRAAP